MVNTVYTTDWIANTFGTATTHVGNAARSMWVAPEGVVYTASMWDEDEGGIAIYQNGQSIGSMGAHGEPQGSALVGTSTHLYAPRQFSSHTTPGNGFVYRYVRATGVNDNKILVSGDGTERRADIITGLATWGQFWAASDLPGNRVRLYKTDDTFVRDIPVTNPGRLAFDRNGNLWVAQGNVVQQYSQAGTQLASVPLASTSVVSELFYDSVTHDLWIGDAGPDMNIKIYNINAAPVFVKTFGDLGGYLNTITGIKGQVGGKRFMDVQVELCWQLSIQPRHFSMN
jgi:hypothetical protein